MTPSLPYRVSYSSMGYYKLTWQGEGGRRLKSGRGSFEGGISVKPPFVFSFKGEGLIDFFLVLLLFREIFEQKNICTLFVSFEAKWKCFVLWSCASLLLVHCHLLGGEESGVNHGKSWSNLAAKDWTDKSNNCRWNSKKSSFLYLYISCWLFFLPLDKTTIGDSLRETRSLLSFPWPPSLPGQGRKELQGLSIGGVRSLEEKSTLSLPPQKATGVVGWPFSQTFPSPPGFKFPLLLFLFTGDQRFRVWIKGKRNVNCRSGLMPVPGTAQPRKNGFPYTFPYFCDSFFSLLGLGKEVLSGPLFIPLSPFLFFGGRASQRPISAKVEIAPFFFAPVFCGKQCRTEG